VAKLDGTFKMPGSGAAVVEQTELQQSIFNAPQPGSAAATGAKAGATDHVMRDAGTPESRGQKRTRDEEDDDSEDDVAMEEDSDDD
jgi:hypothetical protein